MQRTLCMTSIDLTNCCILSKWFSQAISPVLTKHQSQVLLNRAAIIYHFRKTRSLDGEYYNYFHKLDDCIWIWEQKFMGNKCLCLSLLNIEKVVTIGNWNIAYQCEIYEINFNKYTDISNVFCWWKQLNWLKLICTICGLWWEIDSKKMEHFLI